MNIVVGMDSWIIQDGNYGEFCVGNTRDFALEFYPHSFEKIQNKKLIVHQKGDLYDVNAVVDYVDNDSWVIDFGIKVFQDSSPPKDLKVGDEIAGKFSLGVDPFSYFERLKHKNHFPKISYKWKISKIEMETTPFIETAPKRFERDKTRESFKEINETNAWEDFEGSACYLLYCEKL